MNPGEFESEEVSNGSSQVIGSLIEEDLLTEEEPESNETSSRVDTDGGDGQAAPSEHWKAGEKESGLGSKTHGASTRVEQLSLIAGKK